MKTLIGFVVCFVYIFITWLIRYYILKRWDKADCTSRSAWKFNFDTFSFIFLFGWLIGVLAESIFAGICFLMYLFYIFCGTVGMVVMKLLGV